MLEQINMLREKLEEEVVNNAPYEQILATSRKIDALILEYYNSLPESVSFKLTLVK